MSYYGYVFEKYYGNYPIYRPKIIIYFLSNNGSYVPVEGCIDSGADIAILPTHLAKNLKKFSSDTVEEIEMADGSLTIGNGYVFKARLEGKEFYYPVIVSSSAPRPLFGRLGLFDNFAITFEPNQFSVKPLQPVIPYQVI